MECGARSALRGRGESTGGERMSWYRTRVERDLARWQTSGWVSEAGASAIRADLSARKPGAGGGGRVGDPGRGAVRLRRDELRGGQLERCEQARAAPAADGVAVGLLRWRRLAAWAAARRLCARDSAGRHRGVRR